MCHHELWPTSVRHPFSPLNSSLGFAGGRHYQKITIPIFRLVLQNFATPGCFPYILFHRYLSLYLLLVGLLLQSMTLFQSGMATILPRPQCVNTLRTERNDQDFAGNIFKCTFFKENFIFWFKSLNIFLGNKFKTISTWCDTKKATNHYLHQWWPSLLMPYGIIVPHRFRPELSSFVSLSLQLQFFARIFEDAFTC